MVRVTMVTGNIDTVIMVTDTMVTGTMVAGTKDTVTMVTYQGYSHHGNIP